MNPMHLLQGSQKMIVNIYPYVRPQIVPNIFETNPKNIVYTYIYTSMQIIHLKYVRISNSATFLDDESSSLSLVFLFRCRRPVISPIWVLYSGFLLGFFIGVPYLGSLSGFLIWIPYLGSLFRFLIWVPYLDSLFGFLRVSYSGSFLGSLFGFLIQVPYSGYLFRFLLWIPYLASSELLRKSVCGFCLSSDLYSSSWRLKGFSVLFFTRLFTSCRWVVKNGKIIFTLLLNGPNT